MTAFITRMKSYREKLNITQEELAGRVGVRRETIVRLEKGRYNPSLKLAADISRELQTSIEAVFEFEGSDINNWFYVILGAASGEAGSHRTEIVGVCDNKYDAGRVMNMAREQGHNPKMLKVPGNEMIHAAQERASAGLRPQQ